MAVLSNHWHLGLPQNQLWPRTLLALMGGLMLGLPHINANLYWMTWVALVPLLIAIKDTNLKQSFFLGFTYGLGLYTVGAFWIVDFLNLFKSYKGLENYLFSSLFWLYCALLPACLAVSYQWLAKNSSLPKIILFTAVTVFYFARFPVLFSAQLGETQSLFTIALQPIEFFGVYGLDLIIALFNFAVYHALINKGQLTSLSLISPILIAWFGYGIFAFQSWEAKMEQWPTKPVGIVQPNEPPDINSNKIYPGYSRTYPVEMDMTERLAKSGAELIIWPEAKYKGYLNNTFVADTYKHTISNLGIDLIFQDMDEHKISVNGNTTILSYNAAVMLDHNAEQQPIYRKQKRVAFGEYVPFITDVPALKQWVEGFFGDFLNEIAKGPGPVTFISGDLKLIPLICYETMFADFTANAVPNDASGGILVGLSSNGWFGTSIQPYQHVYSASLRAVENRLPMIHALNNGPSAVILPNGRYLFMSDYHQAGGYKVDIPYSSVSGGSLFSRYPWIVLSCVYLILLGATAQVLFRKFAVNKATRTYNNNKNRLTNEQ